ncbi:hypothetical protein T492DRAFT_851463, partial [Pavlovales sp. CCMP2436]
HHTPKPQYSSYLVKRPAGPNGHDGYSSNGNGYGSSGQQLSAGGEEEGGGAEGTPLEQLPVSQMVRPLVKKTLGPQLLRMLCSAFAHKKNGYHATSITHTHTQLSLHRTLGPRLLRMLRSAQPVSSLSDEALVAVNSLAAAVRAAAADGFGAHAPLADEAHAPLADGLMLTEGSVGEIEGFGTELNGHLKVHSSK